MPSKQDQKPTNLSKTTIIAVVRKGHDHIVFSNMLSNEAELEAMEIILERREMFSKFVVISSNRWGHTNTWNEPATVKAIKEKIADIKLCIQFRDEELRTGVV
jgi:hypothetical protein